MKTAAFGFPQQETSSADPLSPEERPVVAVSSPRAAKLATGRL